MRLEVTFSGKMNRLQPLQRIRSHLSAFCSTRAGLPNSSSQLSDSANESSVTEPEQSLDESSSPQKTFNVHDVKGPKQLNKYSAQRSITDGMLRWSSIKDFAGPEPYTFPTLVRYSKLMELGNPEGKKVVGKIFHIVDEDLYIDFGWKFHCVCKMPRTNARRFVVGAKVLLAIKDLELSTRFLGAKKDLTLLEADCVLLRLISSPIKNKIAS